MEYISFTDITSTIMFVYTIQIIVYLTFFLLIMKVIINNFRRTRNHNYFKNNIIKSSNNKSNTVTSSNKYKRTYNDVSKEKLALFNTDNVNNLKDMFYNKFVEFEMAYNNLDYNIMRILSTKQLFHKYYTGITLDLQIGRKKIIGDIERNNVIVFELDSTIAKQTACAMIEVSYFNYTIDKNGYVISGSRENKVTERFEVTFRKDFEREEYVKCQNCGATVSGERCEYCRTAIRDEEFKISSIKRIIDEH